LKGAHFFVLFILFSRNSWTDQFLLLVNRVFSTKEQAHNFLHTNISTISKRMTNSSYFKGKSLFLTSQLLPQFGFDHQTSKPDIFDHLTLKTVHN
jgi:hypothetical protein